MVQRIVSMRWEQLKWRQRHYSSNLYSFVNAFLINPYTTDREFPLIHSRLIDDCRMMQRIV
jgi:hypothetical protein